MKPELLFNSSNAELIIRKKSLKRKKSQYIYILAQSTNNE